ncbi:MAG: hypothetical protein AAGD96_06025 [Chloroflexota bacterium]
MSKENKGNTLTVDLITAAAIGALFAAIQITFHESVHAITCALLGDDLLVLSALHVECLNQSTLTGKIVAISAPIANIVLGLILLAYLRRSADRSSLTKLLVWMFMLMNFMAGTGYFLFSGVANIGDVAVLIEGWEPHWLWRVLSAILGIASFMYTIYLSLVEMGKFIGGSELQEQVGRLNRITISAYVGAILVAVAAGFMNPEGGITGFPAVFGIIGVAGGSSALAWMAQWFRAEMFQKVEVAGGLALQRNWGLIGAGVIVTLIYALVLGPGITF